MKNLFLAAGFAIGLAVSGGQVVSSQGATKVGSIAVNEAKARAILADGSIRFDLPLTGPAVAGERLVAWLLSPIDAVSGETSVVVRPGSRSVTLTLPWSKEAHSFESQE